jgi:hypothetical protein
MSILTWCKWFILLSLPNYLSSDICGDLEEEYTTIALPLEGKRKANYWLVKQTLAICTHFLFSMKNCLSLLVITMAIFIFFTMGVSVFWLSDLADASVLNDVFWQQWLAGNSYQIFFEPILWQSIPQVFAQPVDWSLWLYQPALIYSLISFYFFYKAYELSKLSIMKSLLIAFAVITLPYLLGGALFVFMDIEMNESGPIVAFMWLTTLYLILPVSYQFINKIKMNYNCFA